ncbi:hypothetical protein UFOVP469_22 [uncultured Caudovirales phage]|uniref:Uncharacterized protein n=1 Tax=uncultured Caudovirales phage TaxID=2100421 RepID=A0A6J5R0B0_9CAUD|nr:hypothetical protein UFOVP469_22 [uncultured Caudovirales phage]CAB4190309.1 hypothetical protein UFOVP1200_52 [uncultured Caudovirales phage]
MSEAQIDAGPDYKGRVYRDFHVGRGGHSATGWVIYGRAVQGIGRDSYGPVTKIVAHLGQHTRKPRLWNVRPDRGWRTKREAMAFMATISVGPA